MRRLTLPIFCERQEDSAASAMADRQSRSLERSLTGRWARARIRQTQTAVGWQPGISPVVSGVAEIFCAPKSGAQQLSDGLCSPRWCSASPAKMGFSCRPVLDWGSGSGERFLRDSARPRCERVSTRFRRTENGAEGRRKKRWIRPQTRFGCSCTSASGCLQLSVFSSFLPDHSSGLMSINQNRRSRRQRGLAIASNSDNGQWPFHCSDSRESFFPLPSRSQTPRGLTVPASAPEAPKSSKIWSLASNGIYVRQCNSFAEAPIIIGV